MTLTRQRHDGTNRFSPNTQAASEVTHEAARSALAPAEASPISSNNLSSKRSFASSPTTRFLATAAIFTSVFPLAASASERKIVGVPGWTSGSMTYLRSRPGAQTPPVAKVPRHTKVYVWGTFQGWYRVETSDHIFGWVHNSVLKAPDADKLIELSHRKAILASNRNLASKPNLVPVTRRNNAKTQSSTRIVVAKATPNEAVVQVNTKTSDSATAKTVVIASKLTSSQILAQKAAEVRALEIKTQQAKAQLVKAQQDAARDAQSNASRQSAAQLVAAQQVARDKAVRLEQQRIAKVQADAKLAEAARQARVAQQQLDYRVKLAQQERGKQNRIAAYKTQVSNKKANEEARRQKRLAKYEARKANYQRRLAARQSREKANQNRLAMQRAQLSRNMNASSTRSANASSNATTNVQLAPEQLRPLTPAELMKAREDYLNQNRKPQPGIAASTSADNATPDNSADSSNSSASADASARITPSSLQSSGSSMLTLPLAKTVETKTVETKVVEVKTQKAKTVAARTPTRLAQARLAQGSRGALSSRGGSPLMRYGNRGGSPRDYLRAQSSPLGQGMVTQALSYRGMPYIMGAASPNRGFDCSGLIYFMLRQRGYNPPRTAEGLSHFGVAVSRNDLQPGDILLFANTYKRGISHAGIYMGNSNFVHAANRSRGVATNSLNERYYASKYWGARRVK